MAINDIVASRPTVPAALARSAPVDLHRAHTLVAQARGTLLAASVAAGETGVDDGPEWEAVGAAAEVLASALTALGEEVRAAA